MKTIVKDAILTQSHVCAADPFFYRYAIVDEYPGEGTNFTKGHQKALLLIKEYPEK